jgi:hypothetical protein
MALFEYINDQNKDKYDGGNDNNNDINHKDSNDNSNDDNKKTDNSSDNDGNRNDNNKNSFLSKNNDDEKKSEYYTRIIPVVLENIYKFQYMLDENGRKVA